MTSPLGLQYTNNQITIFTSDGLMAPHNIHLLINTLQNHPSPIIHASFGFGFNIFYKLTRDRSFSFDFFFLLSLFLALVMVLKPLMSCKKKNDF